jgi:hypothetical protein
MALKCMPKVYNEGIAMYLEGILMYIKIQECILMVGRYILKDTNVFDTGGHFLMKFKTTCIQKKTNTF